MPSDHQPLWPLLPPVPGSLLTTAAARPRRPVACRAPAWKGPCGLPATGRGSQRLPALRPALLLSCLGLGTPAPPLCVETTSLPAGTRLSGRGRWLLVCARQGGRSNAAGVLVHHHLPNLHWSRLGDVGGGAKLSQNGDSIFWAISPQLASAKPLPLPTPRQSKPHPSRGLAALPLGLARLAPAGPGLGGLGLQATVWGRVGNHRMSY